MDDFAVFCSRLKDFFARRTSWHRRLWSIGTVLGLQEVLEYTDACLNQRERDTRGLRFVVKAARRETRRDPGVVHIKTELNRVLTKLEVSSPSKLQRSARDELEQLIRRATQEYCDRWRDASSEIPVEFAARSLAAHLLDTGFSADHLFRWLQATQESIRSVGEFAEELAAMAERMPVRAQEVLVPCSAPHRKPSRPYPLCAG